jgi:lysozyme
VGISKAEAFYLLDNDIASISTYLKIILIFNTLNSMQQIALTDMAFNLCFHGILRFRKMWAALEVGDYQIAEKEIFNSTWADQVPLRVNELAKMIAEPKLFPR